MSEHLYTTRREFLAGSLTFLSAASTMPLFLGHTARALAAGDPAGRRRRDDHRILVVIQLAGGNDGLNTVIPYTMDPYYRYRRQLAIPKEKVLRLEQGVGLHPSAVGLKALYDAGRMAIVQGVGYPNPNRSHFVATDIWSTADPNLRRKTGWLGRYFDACCRGADPGPDPVEGIALTKEAPLAMRGDGFTPLAFENPEALRWRGPRRDPAAEAVFRRLNQRPPAGDEPTPAAYLQRAALKALVGADEIRSAAGRQLRGGRFNPRTGSLGRSLQLVARMIAADMPTRVYYVSMGGFDTHSAQLGRQARLLEQLGNAVRQFVETLEAHKLLDRVLIMTFSEFGRRVEENASGGTDHGEAAPMFLFGSRLRPGLHERHPSLTHLHRGDLKFGVDFRRVYATVLRDWLDVRPEPILGGAYKPLRLVRR